MRPCNQCRHPVHNSVLICEECREFNAQSLRPTAPGLVDQPDASNAEPIVDHSFNILMLAFNLVVTALFALLGMAFYSWSGFLVGGFTGLVMGTVLFVGMTR